MWVLRYAEGFFVMCGSAFSNIGEKRYCFGWRIYNSRTVECGLIYEEIFSRARHSPRPHSRRRKGSFRSFLTIWFSEFPESPNYIWDVLDYLKCSFPQVLCEYPSIRDGFWSVRKSVLRRREYSSCTRSELPSPLHSGVRMRKEAAGEAYLCLYDTF